MGLSRRWVATPLLFVLIWAACGSCGGNSTSLSATTQLRDAAKATAQAPSFTLSVAGAEVTYQAPDRVEQVERGQASSASGGSGGPGTSSGPYPETITKIFIAERYYEAQTRSGQMPAFHVAQRCPSDQNAADDVLAILRAIATAAVAESSNGTYTFTITKPPAASVPMNGTATLSGGFVRSLSVGTGTGQPAVTISAVGTAPPVTAPASSTPMSYSCG